MSTITAHHEPSAFETSVADRKRIVAATVEALDVFGLASTDIAAVARVADMSPTCVERHFPSWEGLVLAAVDRWNLDRFEQVARETAGSATLGFMRGLVAHSSAHRGLSRTLMTFSIGSSDAADLTGRFVRDSYRDFHAMVLQGLLFDLSQGDVPAGTDVAALAPTVVSLYMGLQLQMLLQPDVDVVVAFDLGLEGLTRGW
ncbi:TetR/AcrR family transcriptional regulator [Frigoribacterium faeni]|uniref:TetR/AcrR family transcriptional regulator n=1 Tax=Frigoribacterium faeni TaxID=145483 RepID=UPI00141AD200|nr:TetR/AcrR family transcriptional regulator [Frigoribacterium faeni]NIJ04582.1 AcrR family transcriptional regulator [Frigoribacterium faeni]